jgi:hypothetical protein
MRAKARPGRKREEGVRRDRRGRDRERERERERKHGERQQQKRKEILESKRKRTKRTVSEVVDSDRKKV